jgi:hypothetical protein
VNQGHRNRGNPRSLEKQVTHGSLYPYTDVWRQ